MWPGIKTPLDHNLYLQSHLPPCPSCWSHFSAPWRRLWCWDTPCSSQHQLFVDAVPSAWLSFLLFVVLGNWKSPFKNWGKITLQQNSCSCQASVLCSPIPCSHFCLLTRHFHSLFPSLFPSICCVLWKRGSQLWFILSSQRPEKVAT